MHVDRLWQCVSRPSIITCLIDDYRTKRSAAKKKDNQKNNICINYSPSTLGALVTTWGGRTSSIISLHMSEMKSDDTVA